MLILNVFQTLLPFSALIIVASLISYFLTWLLIKKHKKLMFLVPCILFITAIGFAIAGMLSQDWGRLGYLIMAFIALGAFFGSLISSFILKSKNKSWSFNDVSNEKSAHLILNGHFYYYLIMFNLIGKCELDEVIGDHYFSFPQTPSILVHH